VSDRPTRVQITDELGKFKSLTQGPQAYKTLTRGKGVLFIGIGPNPPDAAHVVGDAANVRYVESEAFVSQMPAGWTKTIPQTWQRIQPEDVDEILAESCTVIAYGQAERLFPSFYGPLAAKARMALLRPGPQTQSRAVAVLPADDGDLLAPELASALARAGFEVMRIVPDECPRLAPEVLAQGRPGLFFSVNFRGLDPLGETYHLLEAAGVPVGVWLVDNPFHVLSKLRSPYWRQVPLFVTDLFFIPLLKKHGAKNVTHLPLATDPEVMDAANTPHFQELKERVVFVGRSEFPDKAGFFAGLTLPGADLAEAGKMLHNGKRPDYGWWLNRLGVDSLWPGTQSRHAGLCAETLAREFRISILKALGGLPFTVFGDAGWAELVPGLSDLRGPVDYYTTLPGVYASAGLNCNVTSLLLPAGLTQRHFDVWAAGGMLITDNTPGLSIFPKELTAEITFDGPADLPALAQRMLTDKLLVRDLKTAWREHILAAHTFDARVGVVLRTLNLLP
jgi:spore maturation protein CgeB